MCTRGQSDILFARARFLFRHILNLLFPSESSHTREKERKRGTIICLQPPSPLSPLSPLSFFPSTRKTSQDYLLLGPFEFRDREREREELEGDAVKGEKGHPKKPQQQDDAASNNRCTKKLYSNLGWLYLRKMQRSLSTSLHRPSGFCAALRRRRSSRLKIGQLYMCGDKCV